MRRRCQWLEPIAYPLASQFYKQQGDKSRIGRHEQVAVMREQAEIIAALRLSPLPNGDLLLRALLVAPEYRGQGVATTLMAFSFTKITETLWCFPYPSLKALYTRANFQSPPPEESIPADVLERWQAYNRQQPLLLMRYAR